jgi:histidine ammonia-lyase
VKTITLDGRSLGFDDVRAILEGGALLALSPEAKRRIRKSREIIDAALKSGRVMYGVNTGFGKLSDTRIEPERIEELQKNLLLSHAAGHGEPMRHPRLLIALRANSLAYGNSGVTPGLVERLVELFNKGVEPVIPEVGSVGASGDLAPLAELGCVMIGEGEAVWRGRRMKAREALKKARIAPYRFHAKEALSLVNGTQLMTAILGEVLVAAERLLRLADLAGAMSLEALKGSLKPFDARVQELRPHPGQAKVAENFRAVTADSAVMDSHRNCKKVQDAYCLRCAPQVHGAARDAVAFATGVFLREVNAVTDNPLVFDGGDVISGGNFHGQPVAQAADVVAMALATLANIAERRIDRLTNPDLSELPPFLVKDSGLNSGFMMVQVAAAALAAECRVDASAASVHSIPTGASKEDHVSMGPVAARKARRVVENATAVVKLEMLCAAQGLDFLEPLKPGLGVDEAHRAVRRQVPHLTRDRYLRGMIAKFDERAVLEAVEKRVGRLR